MKISLVMATYNGEKYLVEQMDSIRKQTRRIDQVIFVDDCSNDQTKAIVIGYIKKYELKEWQFYENERNVGFKKNFKKGLSLTDGDIVFLCDQDDIWYENKVESMSQHMDTNRLVIASSFTFMDQQGKSFLIEQKKGRSNNNLLAQEVEEAAIVEVEFAKIIKENFAQGCCLCISKEVIFDYLEIENDLIPHDWSLSLLAASQRACYFYNVPLMKYRIHDNNAIGMESIITNNRLQSRKFRLNNRVNVLEEEKEVYAYLLKYKKMEKSFEHITKQLYNIFMQRIYAIEKRKVFTLLHIYLKPSNKKYYSCRAFVGDVIAMLKK